MAHFAELTDDNIVTRVVVVANAELIDENGQESEAKGAKFCADLFGGRWIQTSYNGTFRKNFAGAGCRYDEALDAFLFPSPFPSWVLNEDTGKWEAPVAMPDDGRLYVWDEAIVNWKIGRPPMPTEGGPYQWDEATTSWIEVTTNV